MTEEEALDRVDSIGLASDNDYNDGEGPDWESVHSVYDRAGNLNLVYNGRYEDGTAYTFTWRMTLVEKTEKGPDDAEHG